MSSGKEKKESNHYLRKGIVGALKGFSFVRPIFHNLPVTLYATLYGATSDGNILQRVWNANYYNVGKSAYDFFTGNTEFNDFTQRFYNINSGEELLTTGASALGIFMSYSIMNAYLKHVKNIKISDISESTSINISRDSLINSISGKGYEEDIEFMKDIKQRIPIQNSNHIVSNEGKIYSNQKESNFQKLGKLALLTGLVTTITYGSLHDHHKERIKSFFVENTSGLENLIDETVSNIDVYEITKSIPTPSNPYQKETPKEEVKCEGKCKQW